MKNRFNTQEIKHNQPLKYPPDVHTLELSSTMGFLKREYMNITNTKILKNYVIPLSVVAFVFFNYKK